MVDSLGYISDRADLCFWLYQQAMLKGARVVLAGCCEDDEVTKVFESEAELVIKMESDVGGYGKLSVGDNSKKNSVLWKTVNNKVEFSQQIAI